MRNNQLMHWVAWVTVAISFYGLISFFRDEQKSLFKFPVENAKTETPFENQYRISLEKLEKISSEEQRFYVLGDIAKVSLKLGKNEIAIKHAKELETLCPKFKKNWNYGNAIHKANTVLGKIALKNNKIKEAKERLMMSGNHSGSPELNTVGPNLNLANELLLRGEKEVVLNYLERCKSFWVMDRGRLDKWINMINQNIEPDFGLNLEL